MPDQAVRPVVTFSYLAAAELWLVPQFPLANDGAEVVSVERSVAGDGPMAAAVLAALDIPVLLLANGVGSDVNGQTVSAWLQRHGVHAAAGEVPESRTPQVVVIADKQDTRTWFSHLPGVAEALAGLDLAPLARASFAYIDCYQLIERPAITAIQAARSAAVPLLLNLGGSPLSPAVASAVHGYPGLIVQTSVDDDALGEAEPLARAIIAATSSAWVVITGGASGVLAVGQDEQLVSSAFRVPVRHTHCAGAAFSGGLIYSRLSGWPMSASLELACASGALRCQRGHNEPMPTLRQLQAVIAGRRARTARCAHDST
jgi:sugar/nucleoside kinase (ribokinase family)